jgi:hypothetical protein
VGVARVSKCAGLVPVYMQAPCAPFATAVGDQPHGPTPWDPAKDAYSVHAMSAHAMRCIPNRSRGPPIGDTRAPHP